MIMCVSYPHAQSSDCVHHLSNSYYDYRNKHRQTHAINQSMELLYKSKDITSIHNSEQRKFFVQSVAAESKGKLIMIVKK